MTELEHAAPLVWLVDSEHAPLAGCRAAVLSWAEIRYFPFASPPDDWSVPPDVVLVSAEIAGGPEGDFFGQLYDAANGIPLIAVARLRSLAQAVAFFRAGVLDYLSLPLAADDVRERSLAAIDRATALAMRGVMVELEPVDADPGAVHLSLRPSDTAPAASLDDSEDILAELQPVSPAPPAAAAVPGDGDDPVAVDSLPIPSLWEELPCGVVVFDSNANLVFANHLALELFGFPSLAELQDALDSRLDAFKALAGNQHPLADNQWPQRLAAKTRTQRSTVLSIEKSDRRRVWLRIDCLPHLHDGNLHRLTMTVTNITGEIPSAVSAAPALVPAGKAKPPRSKRRGGKK